MPRVCTACAHPDREALDRALMHGEPKRQIAARFSLAASAVGRHERGHLPAALVAAEAVREAASADALLRESLELEARALDTWPKRRPAGTFGLLS